MRLGISTCTYTWNFGVKNYPKPDVLYTVDTLLEQASRFDLKVVQILDNIIPLDTFDQKELLRIGRKARDLGIQLEIGTLGITPKQLQKYLDIAGLMGACLVRTIMDGDGENPSIREGAKWIRDILPAYRWAGVRLAIENHDLRTCAQLKELMERVDDESVGICLDMVNSLGAQECQRQVVDTLLPYVINVHYKDFQIRRTDYEMGFTVSGCIAGQGLTDMDKIIASRKKAKGDFNIILEQWMPWMGTIKATAACEKQWAEESIRYLQTRYADDWDRLPRLEKI